MSKVLIISFVFLCMCFQINTKINERMFNWQSHSYNDLRQYPQLLLKNTKLFKVDIYFATDKVCSDALSLNINQNNDEKVEIVKDIDGTGIGKNINFLGSNNILNIESKSPICFVLTHDDPKEGVKYYKAQSIFEFVVDSRFTRYFQENETFWALCFKNVPQDVCSNSSYINLVDKLYNDIMYVNNEFSLKIEFILDGLRDECFRKKWMNWIYAWIHEPEEAMNSDDSVKGYDRFQIYNSPFDKISEDAKKGFGKFSKKDRKFKNRPLQVWEPQDQSEIISAAKLFKSVENESGYAYSINIDPAMLQIYLAEESKEATNRVIVKETNSDGKGLLSVISLTNSDDIIEVVFNQGDLTKNSIKATVQRATIDKLGNSGDHIVIDTLDFDVTGEIIDVVTIDNQNKQKWTSDSLANIVLQTTKQLCYLTLNKNPDAFKLKFSKCGEISYSQYSISNMQRENDLNSSPRYLFLLISANLGKSDIFNFSKVLVDIENQSYTLYNITDLDLSKAAGDQDFKTFNSLKFKVLYKQETSSYEGMIAATSNNQIVGFYVNIDIENHNALAKPFRSYGIGNNFSLSVQSVDLKVGEQVMKKNVFMLVKQDGFCYNNHQSNIQSTLKVCDQNEESKKFLLNYFVGTVGDYNDTKLKTLKTLASPCSYDQENFLISGSFDYGKYPSVSLFKTKSSKINMIELHQGLGEKDVIDDKCGIPMKRNGLVVDSFQLNNILN